MAWLGVPFQLSSAEVFYNARLALDQIPKIIIENADKSVVSDSIIAALIGGAIPALVAYFALKHNSSSLEKQLTQQSELANTTLKAQIVTANRKDWVNDLRDSTSLYLASFQGVMNATNSIHQERAQATHDKEKMKSLVDERTNHLQQMCAHSWKIKLLLKPEHEESAVVYGILDDVVKLVNKHKQYNDHQYTNEITPIYRALTGDIKKIIDREMVRFESIS
ncbi:TPA: hypothetical protein QCI30_004598 [Enterobacter ludwigii]|jgi:hypothetical protein|nr:hypothetical protein [Enterobacter ludwigii]HDR2548413.1 hypothetical protein [Enterobacter ludwigii]HDR2576580.1 hypothetical protein [Enterobacter ludwigii]